MPVTVTTRAGKGSPLTHPEVDANFTGLAALANANEAGLAGKVNVAGFDAAVAATPAVTVNTAKVSNATHTGDVTGSTTLTIANNAVNNSKLSNMPALTIKGNDTGVLGDPIDLTAAQVRALINVADGAQANVPTDLAYTAATRLLSSSTGADVTLPLADTTNAGLAPARSGVATQYLDGTGAYSTPPGGGGGASPIISWLI
jgi:hypothetical protein